MTTANVSASDRRAAADSELVAEVKTLLASGKQVAAGERFAELIDRHQRRAARIAYYYLRDPAEVDEAVQDAFVKAFTHLPSFRERLFFELWFTRILMNGCYDRLKARSRRLRWMVPVDESEADQQDWIARQPATGLSPEAELLEAERRTELLAAVDRLPERQRAVVVLSQFEGHATRDVAEMLNLSEATVRVHLFRAIRTLRRHLAGATWLAQPPTRSAGEAKV
ncbi:MAG: sigma-70 family RNA polymerase sigma factor [Acidobacteria bacterium]|nr:sigma-70 family RNA polymerase sigma factor [Acidobacteriota bacterium]MXZ72827.1 sigma-70 family RNA polymerase sigma factor [Acidobacteriota bacterium]MYD69940.1 sigma-70 family RNA polymerase sigma factor [Acidobacteriota bacterium]MYJ05333.1 sigma-70 family RNA polymerase sigma factor [Acidobacteriota bacterium]